MGFVEINRIPQQHRQSRSKKRLPTTTSVRDAHDDATYDNVNADDADDDDDDDDDDATDDEG
jgi:hypothetical protein